jgi:hypothetical protein
LTKNVAEVKILGCKKKKKAKEKEYGGKKQAGL